MSVQVVQIKKRLGIVPPNELHQIINKICKSGELEQGLEQLSELLSNGYFVHIDEGNSYEGTPIECELFYDTGSNGEHIGYLNLALEITDFKKPLVTHIPMGNSLVFLGNGIKSDLENLINYFHQHNDYADIDLNLIKSLGLNLPAEPVAERWIVDSGKLIEPIPIDIPQGYQYEMTNDGVGVLAPKEAFLENPIIGKWTETNKSLEKVTSFIENKPATALVVLKNVLYELYHSPIDVVHSLKETLVLSEMAYRNLRKIELAERVRELITEINTE